MRISDWSSDVCSSDLLLSVVLRESLEAALTGAGLPYAPDDGARLIQAVKDARPFDDVAPALERLRTKYKTAILSNSERAMMQHNRTRLGVPFDEAVLADEVDAYKPDPRMFAALRSEEHTSELQSLMRISYAVFCLKKKNNES